MANKKKIKLSNKITFSVEGFLNCDELQEGVLFVEVEEEGCIDLYDYIKKFSDEDVKITITTKNSSDI